MVTIQQIQDADEWKAKMLIEQQWMQDRGFDDSVVLPDDAVMRYIERLEAQVKRMTWTTTTPTTPGEWWMRERRGDRTVVWQHVVDVYARKDGTLMIADCGRVVDFANEKFGNGIEKYQWSSEPIAEPTEAS